MEGPYDEYGEYFYQDPAYWYDGQAQAPQQPMGDPIGDAMGDLGDPQAPLGDLELGLEQPAQAQHARQQQHPRQQPQGGPQGAPQGPPQGPPQGAYDYGYFEMAGQPQPPQAPQGAQGHPQSHPQHPGLHPMGQIPIQMGNQGVPIPQGVQVQGVPQGVPQGVQGVPHPGISPAIQPIDELFADDAPLKHRANYKPTSSIPPNLPRTQYAAQCIAAATSSRLPPFSLHPNEYNALRERLSSRHVTTYLNIRNGILRLWILNPAVAVTMVEAAGCVRASRFYGLAEFAFEWLVRNGYINHGCCEPGHDVPPSVAELTPPPPTQRRKPRQNIVVIGAGVAGLAAARQLQNLCSFYKASFAEFADIPKIMILESRHRIGGRIHSVRLAPSNAICELGASTVPGWGGGNPLGTVLRRQLGLPCIPVEPQEDLYAAETGEKLDAGVNYRAHELFGHLLDRMNAFNSGPAPVTARGDKLLIQAGRDPPNAETDADEQRTIADAEDRTKPYHDPQTKPRQDETEVEQKFLQSVGFNISSNARVHTTAKPSGASPSLGKTMDALLDQLGSITELNEQDVRALGWYYAKFEYLIGDCIDKVSLSSWSHYRTNKFTGQHSWVRDGLAALPRALSSTPTALDVRYQTQVKIIEYEDDSVQLQLGNGDVVRADKVIVTVPLGVLKKRAIQFIPDLPQWKMDSIERLGFGTLNKVVLRFDSCFWDPSAFTFRVMQKTDPASRGECFMFQNFMPSTGQPILTALFSGEASRQMSTLDDKTIVARALDTLRAIFKPESLKLEESVVTRWELDPNTYGAYSYVGTDGTIVDHDLLGRPVQQSLFFAGEGTSRFYPGTVHGAYLSGMRVAKEVLNSLVGTLDVAEDLVPSIKDSRPSPILFDSRLQSARSTPQTTTPRYAYPPKVRTQTPVSTADLEQELEALRRERQQADEQHMNRDLLNELGEQPPRPEKSGNTNPFLLFQKDYWDICRKETEDLRKGHASRNEIRTTLGKRWKSLPEQEKAPYIEQTQKTREDNEQLVEEFVRKVKWYEAEADNFRRQWRIDHPEKLTDRERELVRMIQEINPRTKRNRLTD